MINPTGGKVRNDGAGSGYYGAKRGDRIHKGLDHECYPGQSVKAAISGIAVRIAYPYADSKAYTGVLIRGERMTVKMFYLDPDLSLIGRKVKEGDIIGIAQDITKRYPNDKDMTPHIHTEIDHCDPLIFINIP